MKIVAIIGSAFGSKSRVAVNYTINKIKEVRAEAVVDVIDFSEIQFPFADGREYLQHEGEVGAALKKIMEADGLIIGTPIFQASMPGTLKNLFDMLPVNAFLNKVAGMIVTAGSEKHFLIPEQQIRPVLSYMKANLVPNYVFITDQDIIRQEIKNPDIEFRLDRFVDDFFLLLDTYQTMIQQKEAAYDF